MVLSPDTIRLKFPVTNISPNFFFSLAGSRAGELTFKVFKESIKVGSFSYDLNLFIDSFSFMNLEFSVPKFTYGDNVRHAKFSDMVSALACIHDRLSEFCDVPHYDEWEFQRIDICTFFHSETTFDTMLFYQMLEFPRKKKYIYDTSVMFVGNSYSLKVYLKEPEFIKHDFNKILKLDYNRAYSILKESKNIIRAEVTYRKKALVEIFSSKKITIKTVTKNLKKLKEKSSQIMRKILGQIEPKKFPQRSLLEELKKFYATPKATRLYQFYLVYTSNTINRNLIKTSLNRSTISRNMKDLNQIFNITNNKNVRIKS